MILGRFTGDPVCCVRKIYRDQRRQPAFLTAPTTRADGSKLQRSARRPRDAARGAAPRRREQSLTLAVVSHIDGRESPRPSSWIRRTPDELDDLAAEAETCHGEPRNATRPNDS